MLKHCLALGLAVAAFTACVARDRPGDPPSNQPATSLRGPLDPGWIDGYIELRPRAEVPPPPVVPPDVGPTEPESPQAALKILLSSEDRAVNSNWIVYHTAGRDPVNMVGTLHDLWMRKPDQRPFLAKVYCSLISKGGGVGWPHAPDVGEEKAELCKGQMLALLGGVLDHSRETRAQLLRIGGFRMYFDIHPVFLERLAGAPADELPLWGSAISDYEKFPSEYAKSAYDAIIAAVEAATDRRPPFDETGRGAPHVSPYLGNRIARNPSADGAGALAVVIRHRGWYAASELCWPLASLDVAWPQTQDAIAAALARDNSDLVKQACKILAANPQLRERHRDAVLALASHYRPDIRDAALTALPEGANKPSEPAQFRLPAEVLASLDALMPFATGVGIRVKGKAYVCADPNEDVPRTEERNGWLLPADDKGQHCFVSDELDLTFGTRPALVVEEIDFGAELDGRIGAPADVSGEPQRPGEAWKFWGRDKWIGDTHLHDALLLLVCIGWERARGETALPRASALFLKLIQTCSSERQMFFAIADRFRMVHFAHCVGCFSAGADEVALIHAAAWRKFNAWPGLWPEDRQAGVAEIERDVAERKDDRPTAARGSLEYWLQRLPDLCVGQYESSGGAEFSLEKREVLHGIASYGLDAVLPLLDRVDSNRLVRGYSFGRFGSPYRQLTTVGQTATWYVGDACRHFLGVEIDYGLFEPEHTQKFREWLVKAIAASRK